jgi:hypothetical protein
MSVRSRREDEAPEDESYYISMTDMMVGVVFIFILLLTFFGLQYHQTTEALTKADDPKTAALLATADKLESKTVALQIDYANKVVCLPTAALAKDAGGGAPAASDRRCFAYSAVKTAAPAGPSADEARAAVTTFVSADLATAKAPVEADAANGALNFNADALFSPGSDTLSANGAGVVASVANSLAERLPCYGYGTAVGASCANTAKMAAVTVAGNTSFNAFSAEGQQAYALALKRTVAFYKALTADQPVLGQIRDGASPGAQPLLRVASAGQSTAAAAASTTQQFISVQFVMAP